VATHGFWSALFTVALNALVPFSTNSDADNGQIGCAIQDGEVIVLRDNRQPSGRRDGGDPQIVDPDPLTGLGEVDS
jgi:hypothetical protein